MLSMFIGCLCDDKYDTFVATALSRFNEKYGHEPKIYPVIVSDGSRRYEEQ